MRLHFKLLPAILLATLAGVESAGRAQAIVKALFQHPRFAERGGESVGGTEHPAFHAHVLAKDDYAQVLYNRGILNSMIGVEAIRTAMKKFGNKPMTGEQVRWGFENLNLTADRIKQLGFEGMIAPLKVTCLDHEGTRLSRVHQWDGKQWKVISEYYTADQSILGPMVKDAADKYAAEKKITPRDCSKES